MRTWRAWCATCGAHVPLPHKHPSKLEIELPAAGQRSRCWCNDCMNTVELPHEHPVTFEWPIPPGWREVPRVLGEIRAWCAREAARMTGGLGATERSLPASRDDDPA